MDMYAKCGCLEDAFGIFDRMPKTDVVTWNVIIAGFAHARPQLALQLWQRMQHEAVDSDKFTFVCIIKVCSSITHLIYGKLLHNLVIASALECDLFVGSALID
eukprot:c37127_g1_i1 orf=2-307(-)